MKRILITSVAAVLMSVTATTGPAASQTTTDVPTTTVDPGPTTTVDPGPTTTVDPLAPTTTSAPVSIPPVELPGEQITAGSINVGASYSTQIDATCELSGSLAGQEMNLVKDEVGNIGAVYGKASVGGGEVGLVMVELGPLPMAIAAFRTTGACNQDVVGIGAYASTPTSADLSSVGYSIYPSDYLNNVRVSVTVGSSQAPAALDMQAANDFLLAPRPTTVYPPPATTVDPGPTTTAPA